MKYRAPLRSLPFWETLFQQSISKNGWYAEHALEYTGWDDSFGDLLGWSCHGLVMGWVAFSWPYCGMWLRFAEDLHRNIQLQLPGGHQRLSSGCWLCVQSPRLTAHDTMPPPTYTCPLLPTHAPSSRYTSESRLSPPLVEENPGPKVPTLTSHWSKNQV